MTTSETPNEGIRQLVIEKHLEYQLALVNRRWQYFATFLLLNGLLFNIWKDIEITERVLVALLSSGIIIIAIIFLQLISLASKRIEIGQTYLLEAGANVFDYPLDGKFVFRSETIMLYLAFIALSGGWFYLLFVADYIAGIVIAVIFVVNLLTLQWRTKKY